ncbi:MAG: hypothetical protein IT453_15215 [Planctomycetes bacterium]|nr:hypothetical protein [Planctomycetota bacterium]
MLSTASLVLFVLSGLLTLAGFPCCLGCLNWIAAPLCMATALVGFVGLMFDRDPQTRESRSTPVHLMALVGGLVLLSISVGRCLAGGCVV